MVMARHSFLELLLTSVGSYWHRSNSKYCTLDRVIFAHERTRLEKTEWLSFWINKMKTFFQIFTVSIDSGYLTVFFIAEMIFRMVVFWRVFRVHKA